jgi:hypothetical protein
MILDNSKPSLMNSINILNFPLPLIFKYPYRVYESESAT